MLVNVINLEYRIDRLYQFNKEAQAQGFEYKVWHGEQAATRKDTPRCICQSHKMIVKDAKERGLEMVCIAEDDCTFFGEDGKAWQYFLDNMPKEFQLYCGCVFAGEVKENRIVNGMSATMTLYICHNSFYDFMLNELPDNCHLDRYCGDQAYKYKYFIPPVMVVSQRGGYSDNLKRSMTYEPYLEGKLLYGK